MGRTWVVASLFVAGCATMGGGGTGPGAHALAPAAVVASLPLGIPPTLLAISPDGSRVVAVSSGQLSIVRTDTNAIAATVRVAPYPTGVAITPDGRRALVNNLSSARLAVVDLVTGTLLPPIGLVVDIHPGGFGRIAVSSDGRTAYVTNQFKEYLAVVDLTAQNTLSPSLDMRPSDVTLSADGGTLYVTGCKEFCTTGTIEALDPRTRELQRSFSVGPGPYRFALSPDGRRGYTTNLGGPTLSVLDLTSGAVVATLPVGVEPSGLAVSSDGTRVYVPNQAQKTLTIVDAVANAVVGNVAIPSEPREIVLSPDGRRAYLSTRDALLVLDTQRL